MVIEPKVPMEEYKFDKDFRANFLIEVSGYAREQFFLMEQGIRDKHTLSKKLHISDRQVDINTSEIKRAINVVKELSKVNKLPTMKEIIKKMIVEKEVPATSIVSYRFCSEGYLYKLRREFLGIEQPRRDSPVKSHYVYDKYSVLNKKLEYEIIDGDRRVLVKEICSQGDINLCFRGTMISFSVDDIGFIKNCLSLIERQSNS